MTRLRHRVEKLEARTNPGGGVVVTTWYDSRDHEQVERAQQQANAKGAFLVVIRKFSEHDYAAMNGGE